MPAPNDAREIKGSLTVAARSDRPDLLSFVTDAASETALRDGLLDAAPDDIDLRKGGIAAAITTMQRMPSPRVLIVDLSAEEQPLTALGKLADVTEPDVTLLALGTNAELDFYRALTRGLGVREYLTKPITRDAVSTYFAPVVSGREHVGSGMLGGHIVSVTGVRGGGGAATVAVNLAWHFGVLTRRHTVLLDPDMHTGLAAFMLDKRPAPGLRTALEQPDRIDALLAERIALPAAERLHILAAAEPLEHDIAAADGAAENLIEALRRRYSFIVADVPFRPNPLSRALLDLAHQRVLAMEPTLACVRDVLRLLALPPGPAQPQRAVVVLNRSSSAGNLTRKRIEDAIGSQVDVVIPNLPANSPTPTISANRPSPNTPRFALPWPTSPVRSRRCACLTETIASHHPPKNAASAKPSPACSGASDERGRRLRPPPDRRSRRARAECPFIRLLRSTPCDRRTARPLYGAPRSRRRRRLAPRTTQRRGQATDLRYRHRTAHPAQSARRAGTGG